MTQPALNSDIRKAKLFRNNRSQAVRIPAEFEFSGNRVLIHKEGDRLIIEPEPRPNLLETLRSLAPLAPEDALPEDLNATLLPLKDVDL
jgi:antitoxin VapB